MPRKKAKRSKPYKARPTGQRDVQIEFQRGFAGNNQLADQFDDMAASRDGYPETVGSAPLGLLRALGARYLEETASLRTGREHFTDKLPNNFSHIGLINAAWAISQAMTAAA